MYSNLEETLCLSLACYSSQKILDNTKQPEESTNLERAISKLHSVWPKDGGLEVIINHMGRQSIIPLAPPFVVCVSPPV